MTVRLDDGYEIIVLGDSIASLVAATTAANHRAETLWLPHERRTWSVHAGGHDFPVEEGLVTGMAPGGAFTLLCEATGLHPSEALKFEALEPGLQVITPALRLGLPAAGEALAHELRLECGEAPGTEARRFLERADATRRQVDTWLTHLVHDEPDDIPAPPQGTAAHLPEPLAGALDALVAGVTHTIHPRSLATFERARALGAFRAGVFGPRIELREDAPDASRRRRIASSAALAIRHLLAARARHTPMTIARDARVAKIRTSWSRLRGVTLDDGQRIAGRVVISGLDEGDGIQVEGWTRRPRSGVLPPSPYRAFTIHLLVGRHVLPEGLGPRAVLARDSAEPLVGSNHVIVSRGPIAEDVCRLALTFRVPSDASAETRQKTGREAIDHLREVVPFLDDDLRGVFPPLETPEDLRPDRKQSDPWAVARGPLAVNGPGAATPTARFDTSIGHLLKTGATTLPGFGYEGELLAGVSAGRRALKLVGRRH